MSRAALFALVALAACAVPVDPDPIGDYTTWKRIDVRGPAPGHGDTYRIIYVNDVAADPAASLTGGYPDGSIIVKEIWSDDGGQPGDLRYLAIMRQLQAEPEHDDEAGWLFTQASTPGGAESYRSLCWNRCHVAAPYRGAWYDYRK